MAKYLIGGCLGSLVLTACATGFTQAPVSSPHATFKFQKAISSKLLMRGTEPSIVTYQLYNGSACSEPVAVANFGPLSSDEKALRFPAGVPTRMVVNMVYKPTSISTINGTTVAVPSGEQQNCIGVVRFNPDVDKAYSLSAAPTDNPKVCALNVIEVVSKRPPQDLLQGETDVCQ